MMARKVMTGASGELSITSPNHLNLIQHLTFDNLSGSTILDESPNGNDATNVDATFVTGNRGDSAKFVTDHVNLPIYNDGDTKGAYSFWLKINQNSTTHRMYHINNFTLNKGLNILLLSTNKIRLLNDPVSGGSSNLVSTGTITMASGWVHVVAQSDGADWTLYFNASLDSTKTGQTGRWLENIGTTLDRASFGGVDYAGGPLYQGNFELDDWRYFDRDLTTQEITDLHNGGAGA